MESKNGLHRTPAGRELIVSLSKKVLAVTAPEELQGFEEFTGDYFTDPKALKRSDKTLGAGFGHLPELIILVIFMHRLLDLLYRRHVQPLSNDVGSWAASVLTGMAGLPTARESPAAFTPEQIHQALAATAIELQQERSCFVAEHWQAIQDLVLSHLVRVKSGPIAPLRILFLGASPRDTMQLALEREVAEIRAGLEDAPFRSDIHLRRELAATSIDVQEHLLRYRPHLVHFSGHGTGRGAKLLEDDGGSRDLAHVSGNGPRQSAIILEDSAGRSRPVSAASLGEVFAALRHQICCLVLNACFSAEQAEALIGEVDCIVGMSAAIHDDLAIGFSRSFYQAIGYGESLATAFALGRSQIGFLTGSSSDIATLVPGKADPAEIFPVSKSWRRPP